MTTYAKKACYSCGALHPQPEMNWIDVTVNTSTSHRALMVRNVLGWLFGWLFALATGNKRMQRAGGRAVLGWAVGNHKRQYKREKRYWYCFTCTDELVESGELWYET